MKQYFLAEESGQGMVEYSLILTAVAMAVFLAYRTIGGSAKNRLDNFVSRMP
jgi:Flp pilus assembly pilin Flp